MAFGNQKPEAFPFLQNNSASQIKIKISLTGLNVSFSDLGCFNLECEMLQPKIGFELTES